MAYIIGLLTPEEKEELERRGWKVEPAPKKFKTPSSKDGMEYGMVYADNDMLQIMSGNDWDKGPPKTTKVTICDIQVTEREVEVPTSCSECGASLLSKDNNLEVWEYSNQKRIGHLQNDGDEDDDVSSTMGVNIASSDLDGGDSFIENIAMYCRCGNEIASGKFDRIAFSTIPSVKYHIECIPDGKIQWELCRNCDSEADLNQSMNTIVACSQYKAIRTVKTVKTGSQIDATVLHTYLRGNVENTSAFFEKPTIGK